MLKLFLSYSVVLQLLCHKLRAVLRCSHAGENKAAGIV